MKKMTEAVKAERKEREYQDELIDKKAVINYMGGISYEVNPLMTLKMVSTSSIFGEPQYYRDGEFEDASVGDGCYSTHQAFLPYSIILNDEYQGKTTSEIMEDLIDKALEYDFKETLVWAVQLRREYNMRLNPQVIMVRAALHPKRVEFTTNNPGFFAEVEQQVMSRGDEPATQLTYYLYKNKSIKGIPNILKKSWAKRISRLSRYEMAKYKNKGVGLIDTVRVSHAKGELVDELMKTGSITASEKEKTWENLRADGATWVEIVSTIRLPHMALLRNLRGIFSEVTDQQIKESVLDSLLKGVKSGKQFPFAYKSAADAIGKSALSDEDKAIVMKALEDCIEIATEQMPKLKGRTVSLSDNSGSARGSFTSEYGTVTVANIDNLSSVITAKNSDEGYVGVFGDCLSMLSVHPQSNTLKMAKLADQLGKNVGAGTENGVWLFFDEALKKKEHWDNIFIYSDMQAGHGGLYGLDSSKYLDYRYQDSYIDVSKLVDTYRKTVNPKVNVFMVQTAGYSEVLVPEYGYRTNILYGWTGKELVFADRMNKLWDEFDIQQEKAA